MLRAPDTATLDLLWKAPVIASTVLTGEMLATVLALAPGVEGSRWIYFGLASLLIQWISLLTLGCLYVFRRRLNKLRPTTIANFAVVILLTVTSAACTLVWGISQALLMPPETDWWQLLLQFIGISLTVGMLGLVAFQNHWRARQFAVRAKQAELEALQARIHPHFLFNTLNTGVALLRQRPDTAERLLLDLADLFRAALGGASEVALEQELSLAKRYLEIEALRFGSRLQVDWHLPATLPVALVPSLAIQTLTENAIRHGVEPSRDGGKVTISVLTTGNALIVSVVNEMPAIALGESSGHKIGLNAVRSRVEQLTDGKGRLETTVEDGRYIATIFLPLRSEAAS